MARLATLSIRDQLDSGLLTELARIWSVRTTSSGFLDTGDEETDEGTDDDPAQLPDWEAFEDWDRERGHGRGFFRGDERECATRRVDLRGPTDLDPGPLPMDEPPPDLSGSAWMFTFES